MTSVKRHYLEPLKHNYLFFQSILLLSLLCKTQKSWLSKFLVPEILNNTLEFPSGFKYSLNHEAIKNAIEIENQDEQLSILGDQAQIICVLNTSALLFEGMKIDELNTKINEHFTEIDPANGNKLYKKFRLICEFFRHIFVHAKDWKVEEKSLERFKKDHKTFLEENQNIIKFIAKGENLYLNIELDFNNINPGDNIFNFIKSEQIIGFLEFSHQITDHLQNSINKIENEATGTAK